jgi:hypothetical protein
LSFAIVPSFSSQNIDPSCESDSANLRIEHGDTFFL